MLPALPRPAATFAILLLAAIASVRPAAAEEESLPLRARLSIGTLEPGAQPGRLGGRALFPIAPPVSAEQVRAAAPLRPAAADFSTIRRPSLLPALYAGTVALQALDAHSTLRALDAGAREANPVMRGVAGSATALVAVKAGAATATIYFAERMWRRNRAGAVVMMAVVNGVSAAIVARNYKVARDMR